MRANGAISATQAKNGPPRRITAILAIMGLATMGSDRSDERERS
jgi:hypothetical protein